MANVVASKQLAYLHIQQMWRNLSRHLKSSLWQLDEWKPNIHSRIRNLYSFIYVNKQALEIYELVV